MNSKYQIINKTRCRDKIKYSITAPAVKEKHKMKPTVQLLRQSGKGSHKDNKSLSFNGAAAERPLLQQHRRHPLLPRHRQLLQGSLRESRSSLRKGKELGLFSSNPIISYEYTDRRSSIHKYINAKHVENN